MRCLILYWYVDVFRAFLDSETINWNSFVLPDQLIKDLRILKKGFLSINKKHSLNSFGASFSLVMRRLQRILKLKIKNRI